MKMFSSRLDYLHLAHRRAKKKETHVSFPQLKYPSLRDEGSKHPTMWLKGKVMDDGAEGLWRVHDGLYDLNDFIKKHPGGQDWLELSKGTDITEAFESHHISPAVWQVLRKFYIRDARTPRNSPFTFKDDGFYKSLKRAVRDELKNVPKHAHRLTDLITDGLLITCLVTSVLSCWSKNYWLAMGFYLVASLSLGWLVVASHNYIHSRNNWRMYLFNLSMWSYRDFRVSHCLSHHLYTNTLMDLEISGFEPFVFWNPRKQPLIAYFGFVTQQLVYPFSFFINFIGRFMLIFSQKNFYIKQYRWPESVSFILPLWIWIMSGETLPKALYSWFWIYCTASYIFMTIGTNAGHHHPEIFKDGDQVRDVTPDWGIHQLDAVIDRSDINGNLFKVLTFFGDHTLHHLFPALDHAVLPYLYPVFLDHCQKFRANFRQATSLHLFIGQIKETLRTDPTVLQDQ